MCSLIRILFLKARSLIFPFIFRIHLCGAFCSMLLANCKNDERRREGSRKIGTVDFPRFFQSILYQPSQIRSGSANSWTDAIKIVNSPEIMHRARFTTATKNRSLLYKIRDSKERDGGINRVNRI